jgi:transposase-like protein
LVTRVGKLELQVPQDRQGRFSTEIFDRYQRSEKALVACLAEMYVQGVSTRKVKAITEELCGDAFSASSISRINKTLDEELKKFATRHLDEEYPYLILDARYEKVREDGVIRTRAVMIAIGINWDGRRSVLAVELAQRESQTTWRDFIVKLKERGLIGVEFVVSDHHLGLKKAIGELLQEAIWQLLLRPFPSQCTGSSAAKGRRRLFARTAMALRPSQFGRSAPRSFGLANSVGSRSTRSCATGSKRTLTRG